MKVSVIQRAIRQTALAAGVALNLLIVPNVSAQALAPPAQVTTGATAEVERVIVTGSNIPTAEETGPSPVDTHRPADLEKLGIRNATDLTTFLPAGGRNQEPERQSRGRHRPIQSARFIGQRNPGAR